MRAIETMSVPMERREGKDLGRIWLDVLWLRDEVGGVVVEVEKGCVQLV